MKENLEEEELYKLQKVFPKVKQTYEEALEVPVSGMCHWSVGRLYITVHV